MGQRNGALRKQLYAEIEVASVDAFQAHPRTHTRAHARKHAHARMHARTHPRTHTHTDARTHARKHTHPHTQIHAHTQIRTLALTVRIFGIFAICGIGIDCDAVVRTTLCCEHRH